MIPIVSRPSPNWGDRPADTQVDMLVLHYTGMLSAQAALDRLCDPAAEVSAHYLIDEDGVIFALVEEHRRAWHAGRSYWRGSGDVNSRSIGIELVNPGHEFGYRPFPEAQMAALSALAKGILARHPIPARNVVGHSDVAPTRKQDPGELFDWQRLAGQGIGLWPGVPLPSVVPASLPAARHAGRDVGAPEAPVDLVEALGLWGYDVSSTEAAAAALVAFQRHFRPDRCDGCADGETLARLATLLRMDGETL